MRIIHLILLNISHIQFSHIIYTRDKHKLLPRAPNLSCWGRTVKLVTAYYIINIVDVISPWAISVCSSHYLFYWPEQYLFCSWVIFTMLWQLIYVIQTETQVSLYYYYSVDMVPRWTYNPDDTLNDNDPDSVCRGRNFICILWNH